LNRLSDYVSEDKHFNARIEDPTTSYGLTFINESEVNRWLAKCDMTFNQNQVNFAVYCATTLSDLPDFNKIDIPLIKSIYQFHFYYQQKISLILGKIT
jgi:hypothetical protein